MKESKLSLSQLSENLLNYLKDLVKAEDYESFTQKVLDEYEDISQRSKDEYLVFSVFDLFIDNPLLLLSYKDLEFHRTHDWNAVGYYFIPLDKVDTSKLLDYLQEGFKEPKIKHIILFINPHDLSLSYSKTEESKYIEYSN